MVKFLFCFALFSLGLNCAEATTYTWYCNGDSCGSDSGSAWIGGTKISGGKTNKYILCCGSPDQTSNDCEEPDLVNLTTNSNDLAVLDVAFCGDGYDGGFQFKVYNTDIFSSNNSFNVQYVTCTDDNSGTTIDHSGFSSTSDWNNMQPTSASESEYCSTAAGD